ncbi:MAG: hydantoinase/oxoprolinase family protein [Chloroflexi bacterium]|nr:hydantoinase/oxoprolinase family protein [Chloroflexota bacterium]
MEGEKQCITLDIGGTSADVSIVRDGEVVYSTENHVADFPVVMPSADVSTIGAGGGSIASIDEIGILKVGPRSAGADPGPACYGKGGKLPTITDAYLVCGYVNPDNFLGGRMRLDRTLAAAAIGALAEKLGKGIPETAESILAVASSNMADELRPLTAKRGIDPRDFALLVYGGAGPTHGALLLEESQIGKMLVPPSPGTLCALGALMTDVRGDYIKTVRKAASQVGQEELSGAYRELDRQAIRWVREQGPVVNEHIIIRSADLRYNGEPYDVEVSVPCELDLAEVSPSLLRELFHEAHQQAYSFMDREAAVILTNLRVRVVGLPPLPTLAELPGARGAAMPLAERDIFYRGAWRRASIYDRKDLLAGHLLAGPAIVEQVDTTTVILPGLEALVDRFGILTVKPLALAAASGASHDQGASQ